MINMINLKIWLLNIFITFLLLCIATSSIVWIYYHRCNGFELAARDLKKYRYFIWPYVDNKGRMISCALILREFDHKSKSWVMPYNIKHFPLDRLIIAINDIKSIMPSDVNSISINMTLSQFLDPQVEHFFNWILGIINHQKLNIELDAGEILHLNSLKMIKLKKMLEKTNKLGILVTVKNIDSTEESYNKLIEFENLVEHYSLSTYRFNLDNKYLLNKWINVSKKNGKQLCLSGVNSAQMDRIANELEINIRQGMYYFTPVPVRSMQAKIVE